MPIMKKTNRTDMREMRDHRDNTAGELIKCYTLSQLSIMDGIDTRTIRSSGRYLPVRVDNSKSLLAFKKGLQKRPYTLLWIRLDEIRDIFSKRNKGKKLTID